MTDANNANNVEAFLGAHGVEGLLTLYFTNYLVELIKGEMKSESEGTDLLDDPGVQYYFGGTSIDAESSVQQFEDALFDECKPKAREMVQELKDDDEFQRIFEEADEEVLAILEDDRLEDRFQEKMHILFEKWEAERED